MPKARAVEADNAISLSKEVDESAGHKVLDHGTIAMQHHYARGVRIAALDVMELNAIAL